MTISTFYTHCNVCNDKTQRCSGCLECLDHGTCPCPDSQMTTKRDEGHNPVGIGCE